MSDNKDFQIGTYQRPVAGRTKLLLTAISVLATLLFIVVLEISK